jgi:nucleoside-diphosphate-sugar epimerase
MSRVVITGSGGFVGAALTARLNSSGHEVVRVATPLLAHQPTSDSAALESLLRGADAVIHLAARAHVMVERDRDPLSEYRKSNVDGTRVIAEAAVRMHVPRFVFVSSIGVLGNRSGDTAFTEQDAAAPVEPYAVSKWEAECALRAIENNSSLEVVIVRPPLVYGPHVRGNFLRLLRLVSRGIPLPLGSIKNRRSYVAVDNLTTFLITCAFHSAAAGRLFLIADGEDVSTPALLRLMAASMNSPSRVFPCPLPLLSMVAAAVGRRADLYRLAGSLRVDATAARTVLGWQPTTSLQAGVARMVQWFLSESHR